MNSAENQKDSSFDAETLRRIQGNSNNVPLIQAARAFMEASTLPKYSYNFKWVGLS